MSNNTAETILKVEDLKMHFPIYRGVFQRQVGAVHAVDGVSFNIIRGETLGLVGESGCGKSTAGRAILQLYKPTAGEVHFEGVDLIKLRGEEYAPDAPQDANDLPGSVCQPESPHDRGADCRRTAHCPQRGDRQGSPRTG